MLTNSLNSKRPHNYSNDLLDSISFRALPVIGFKMEIKNFFIDNQWSRIQELKPYIEYQNKLRIGVGYCWLKKGHVLSDSLQIKISAINFFVSYRYYVSNKWLIDIPLDFGFGRIKKLHDRQTLKKGYYSFYEPNMIVEFRGFKYFNLGFGTGLRLTTSDKEVYSINLTRQTIIFRFGLKFNEIYKSIFNPIES